MTLNHLTISEVHALRDKVEDDLIAQVGKGIREFLRLTKVEAIADTRSPLALVAAGSATDPLTLGQMQGWWTTVVDQQILEAVRAAWVKVYRATRDGTIISTSLDGLDTYMTQVRDRLVQGLVPSLPEDAFNKVRVAVTQSAAEGWTRTQLADRIGAELSWETKGPYWRGELSRIDGTIDGILDPLGEPGTQVREHARLNDPRVKALRADRNTVIKSLDLERSHWSNRANLIARTEATGANNFGALSALGAEGVTGKQWISTNDQRTRPHHREAGGQTVPIDEPFIVGGHEMQMPGDPNAPVDEVANCRCCVIAADLAGIV